MEVQRIGMDVSHVQEKRRKLTPVFPSPSTEDMDILLESVQEDERTRIRRFHFEADKKRGKLSCIL